MVCVRYSKGNDGMRGVAGFTLIEIMVVIVILAVLATLIIPKIMDRPDEARRTKAVLDIQSIGQALDLYRLDSHRYPTTEQGLNALVEKPQSEPILSLLGYGYTVDSRSPRRTLRPR